MEQFFSPTRDIDDPDDDKEDVILEVTDEAFLDYSWDWADLWHFASSGDDANPKNKKMWITEEAFLTFSNGSDVTDSSDFEFDSVLLAASTIPSSGHIQTLQLFHDVGSDLSRGVCEIFWRAVKTSNRHSTRMSIRGDHLMELLPDGPTLSEFVLARPSLQVLDFQKFRFMDFECRALATIQRKDLEVTLSDCTLLDPPVAHQIFPLSGFTELQNCRMGTRILSALSGNSSVKRLSFRMGQLSEDHIHSLARALPTNHGIVHVSLKNFKMIDETWILFFRSLSTHPLIGVVSLRKKRIRLSAQEMTTRMQAILEMLHLNTVVHTIELPDAYETEELYQNSILPRLEMNRNCFEVQRQAVKRADPYIRPQLLGRALHVVRYNPHLVFRFLSENIPAFVRREEEEDVAVAPMEQDPIIVSGSGPKRKAPS